MNPKEFIASKKSEFPKERLDEAFFESDFYKEKIAKGESIEDFKKKLENRDYCEYLFERYKNHFPPPIISIYEHEWLAFGEINWTIPNAHCYILGDMRYAVTFNSGLKNFIYRVIRAYATRIVIIGKEDQTISFEETCQKIADIFWWFGVTQGQSFGPSYPISNDQILAASELAVHAEFFFLAHEVGHVFIDLLKLNGQSLENTNEEFEADRFALLICLGFINPKEQVKGLMHHIIYSCCELALLIFGGLEKLGFEVAGTHPSALDRIDNLRRCLREICKNEDEYNQLVKFADGNTHIYNRIIEVISQPNEEERKYFSDKAGDVINEVNNLLYKCSGGLVPDYSTFYFEMNELFKFGYYHVMMDEVFNVGNSFFKDILAFKKGDESFNESSSRNFFKFKLFFGFIQQLPDPVKELFAQKLS